MGSDSSKLSKTPSFLTASSLNLSGLRVSKSKRHRKVLILSLDSAGKTSLLYRIKTGQLKNTIPTVGYNHETIEYRSSIFEFWDLGGQEAVRQNWGSYFHSVQAIIFVVDSNDPERMDEVRYELQRIEKLLYDHKRLNAVILILANKQDLPNAMSYHEIHSKLFQSRSRVFHWEIRTSCNKTGAGVMEALEWLHKELKTRFR